MPCFKLLEDDGTLAMMDIYPANEGHCLVLSKEHFPTVRIPTMSPADSEMMSPGVPR